MNESRIRNIPYGRKIRQSTYKTTILTRRSTVTDVVPRNPLFDPITWDPARTWPKYMLLLKLCYWHLRCCHNWYKHLFCIMNLSRDASFFWRKRCHWHRNFCAAPIYWFDLQFLIWLRFPNLTRSSQFDSTTIVWK